MSTHYQAIPLNNGPAGKAGASFTFLDDSIQARALVEDMRLAQFQRYMDSLCQSNLSWLDRLLLTKEDRALFRIYSAAKLKAAAAVMENHVRILSFLCKTQELFIQEVIETVYRTSLSGFSGVAAIQGKKNILAMQNELSKLSNEFYTLMEHKYLDAQGRLPFVQRAILMEIEMGMNKWIENMRSIQENIC